MDREAQYKMVLTLWLLNVTVDVIQDVDVLDIDPTVHSTQGARTEWMARCTHRRHCLSLGCPTRFRPQLESW